MKTNRRILRVAALMTVMITLIVASARLQADTGTCGGVTTTLPFTDVMGNPFFCQIAGAYFSGLTNGTSATTYSPDNPVTREQMAAFMTRTLDQSLKRGSRRAALRQWWTPQSENSLGLTTVGNRPGPVETDGADLWVGNRESGTVSRVRASDGTLLGTWTGALSPAGVLVAMGKVFVTGSNDRSLYQIDPTQPPGEVTTLTTSLGLPNGIAFDGTRIWTANFAGSVSIVTLNPTNVTNVSTGFLDLFGILYDGSNIWVTDAGDRKLKKLDSNGAILQSIDVGQEPRFPTFDGTNIWVPNIGSNTVTVVRVKDSQGNPLQDPFLLATLSGNGLNRPNVTAFDGERMLVTNSAGNSVSLWE